MVHFEFGQEQLSQPRPLNTFELAQGGSKGAFVLFSTILIGLVWVRFAKSLFLPHELA